MDYLQKIGCGTSRQYYHLISVYIYLRHYKLDMLVDFMFLDLIRSHTNVTQHTMSVRIEFRLSDNHLRSLTTRKIPDILVRKPATEKKYYFDFTNSFTLKSPKH